MFFLFVICMCVQVAEREPNQVGFDGQICTIPSSFPLDILPICPAGKAFGLEKICCVKTAKHPPANAFLIDFGVILRSKIQILQAKARRKMRKCIVVGQFGSAPVWLKKAEYRNIQKKAEYRNIQKKEHLI
ncbi:MAG: hypothetical protein E7594_08265 [Ruminococcaceae bacterium]|nr:hypothetical protein [Oscillospiraceae bacterium]